MSRESFIPPFRLHASSSGRMTNRSGEVRALPSSWVSLNTPSSAVGWTAVGSQAGTRVRKLTSGPR